MVVYQMDEDLIKKTYNDGINAVVSLVKDLHGQISSMSGQIADLNNRITELETRLNKGSSSILVELTSKM